MQLHLSATPRATLPGGPLHVLAPLDGALLAWLALEGPTPRNRLATLLWPDKAPEAARNSLRQRLFQLRRQIGADLVDSGATAALAEGVSHDLHDADTLLDGVALEIGGEYAQWLALQRDRRQARVRRSLAELAAMAETAKDWDDALAHAGELLALEPLSEEAHRRVIRLHYLAGDRAAALLAFDRCEQVLKNEVGAQPSAETMALLATIEQSNVSAPSLPAVRRTPAAVLRPPRLVGREVQWQALHDLTAARLATVLVGEGGMGKSRLVADFTAVLAGAAVSVAARPGDAPVPYACLVRLARALVQRAGAPDVAVQRSLARLLPEFGSPPAGDDEAETARLLAALESVLSAAAAAGVAIVVVDDLHFADRASTEALCHLASLQGGPTWIFAARPADGPAPMHDAIEPLLASGQVQRIELTPLSAAQIAELVDSLGVPGWHGPSLAPRLVRHTGGNPQFVLETLKAMPLDARQGDDPERLPVAPTVTLLVGRRISKLSADAVRIARCAALAGQDFSAELATALLGVRPLDLADAWAELESAQVLREQAFAHDLIREAALASVPLALARQLHGQIAEFLAAHDGAPARIAEHWLASSRPQAAVPHLQEAGRRAIRALRKTEAAQAYERAAELLEQGGDRAAAFDVLHTFFEQALPQWDASSRRLMDRLIVLAETPRQHALAGCRHAVQLARSGDFDASGAAAAAALALVDAHAEPALAATLMSFRVASLLQHGQFDEAVQTMYRAVALAETAGDEETLFTTVGTLASALDWAHRDVEAQPQHARALSLAQRGGQPENIIAASVNLASNALSLGHLADADRALGLAERTAVVHDLTIGDEWPAAVAIRARIALDLGDFVRAVRAAEDALALYERRMPHSLIGVQNMVTTLWMRLGQWARAHRSAQQALALRDGAAARYAVLASKLAAEVEAAVEGAAGRLQALDEVKATLAASDTLVVSQIDLSRCRWLEPRDAHVLALRLRDQARAAAVRPSELDAEVMCARAALRAGDRVAASAHARAALSLFSAVEPYALYRAEVWLAAAQALESVDAPRARRVLEEAQQWVKATAAGRVPPEFRDSFLHRNPVNRELLALAAALPR